MVYKRNEVTTVVPISKRDERKGTIVRMFVINLGPFKIKRVRAIFLIHEGPFRIKVVN